MSLSLMYDNIPELHFTPITRDLPHRLLSLLLLLVFDGHTQTHTLHIPPPPPPPAALHSVCRPADKCSALQPLLSISCRNHVCAEEGIYCPELILLNRRWQRLDSPRRQHERVDNQTNTHK